MYSLPADKAYHAYKSADDKCANWKTMANDILEVTVSSNNNRYLLVVQDYSTKWADARSLPDQTASRIITELMDLFTPYGIPETVNSDQGRN